MKIRQVFTSRDHRFEGLVGAALLSLASLACTGNIIGDGPGGGMTGSGGGGGMMPPLPPGGTDVGRVAIHRLNNLEYKNTIHDLVGVDIDTANFPSTDGKDDGFDNIADEFVITDNHFQLYFNTAVDVSEKVFAAPALASKILSCTPASAADVDCIKTVVRSFGLRAWRRPLKDSEITDLTKVATDAIGMGENGAGAIKQVVKTMLAAPFFLYRIEYDPDPASTTAHALDPFELASRLSYLHWSTMPDTALLDLAQNGDLLKDAVLTAQVDRMLADTKGQLFVQRFAGQWLGMDHLLTHAVNLTTFPMWDEPLRQAMYQEGLMYFQEFLTGGLKMKDFFTTKLNFINAKLARIYGVTGVTGTTLTKVSNMAANRLGFMGLATFLTNTSIDYRTSPTSRGKWVLAELLCQPIPEPPAKVPELDGANPMVDMAQSENVRKRLEAHRAMPDCAGCHAYLDPIGLGLETFDAIGQYRATYPNGDMIDPAGVIDTKTFTGLDTLAAMLSDPKQPYLEQLTSCAAKKLMTYSLSRVMTPKDEPYITQMTTTWAGGSMKDLLKLVVLNPTFRFRHGEP